MRNLWDYVSQWFCKIFLSVTPKFCLYFITYLSFGSTHIVHMQQIFVSLKHPLPFCADALPVCVFFFFRTVFLLNEDDHHRYGLRNFDRHTVCYDYCIFKLQEITIFFIRYSSVKSGDYAHVHRVTCPPLYALWPILTSPLFNHAYCLIEWPHQTAKFIQPNKWNTIVMQIRWST